MNEVPNGKKYSIPYDDKAIYILNLTGNSYQMVNNFFIYFINKSIIWIYPNYVLHKMLLGN